MNSRWCEVCGKVLPEDNNGLCHWHEALVTRIAQSTIRGLLRCLYIGWKRRGMAC